MFRRSLLLLALAALAAGSAQPALATGPTCSAHTPSLRYKPEYTATCSANILAVTVVKTSNGKTVGIGAPAGLGTTDVTADVSGALASAAQYKLKLSVD